MSTTCRNINANITLSYAFGGPVITGGIRLSSFSLTLGLGSQSSVLDVELIGDPCSGQAVSVINVGSPVRFSCNSLVFGGIVNSSSYSESASGVTYKLKIIDPRKILENVSVLLQGYYCDLVAPNFINIASFVESGAAVCPPGDDTHNWPRVGNCRNFGKINTANGVYLRQALVGVQSKNPVVYTTSGETLYLSLGKIIAITPPYAKIEATTSSLLSIISQACDEGGCDFIVSLVGSIIDVVPINRRVQPRLGVISGLIATAQTTGTLINGEIGTEEIYENSNKIILGENVQYLRSVIAPNNVAMMLGEDLDGNPIRVYNTNFNTPINISTLAVGLASQNIDLPWMWNISESEIIAAGSTDMWKLYGLGNPNSLSGKLLTLLGIRQELGGSGAPKGVWKALLTLIANPTNANSVNTNLETIGNMASAVSKARNSYLYELAYEWFQDFISTYYGRKWLVPMPYICASPMPFGNKVSEGGYIHLSDVPSDGGWPNQTNLLGLTYGYNTSLFETPDGRLGGFLRMRSNQSLPRNIGGRQINFIPSPEGLDPSTVLQIENNCFIKVVTDGEIYRRNSTTAEVLITSPFLSMTPALNKPLVGEGMRALAVILGDATVPSQLESNEIGASVKSAVNVLKLGKPSCGFDYASVPMKSNVYVYGPWSAGAGSIGSTSVETTNLSPWNYGGVQAMQTVGRAMASAGLRLSNKTESGSMTLAEPPGYSIEYFISAAIMINNINVNYNSGGVTTTYNFQTYSPKFGQYGKTISDNVQKTVKIRNEILGKINEQRRKLITSINSTRKEMAKFDIKHGKYTTPQPATKKASPSYLLVGGYYDPLSPDKAYTVGLNSANQFETSSKGTNFQNLAIMSLDGLLAPVSLQGRGEKLPRFAMSWGYEKGNESHTTRPCMPPINNKQTAWQPLSINRKYLNPIVTRAFLTTWEGRGQSKSFNIRVMGFGNNDISNSYDIFDADEYKYDRQTDFGFYALRGPLVLQSWGYDTEGKPIPNIIDDPQASAGGVFQNTNTRNKFMENWLSKPESWPVGPIDLRYDRDRGVWVAPTKERILLAKLTEDLSESGVAEATLLNNSAQGKLFHENYKVWGPNGEDIISNIDQQSITVYNFLDSALSKDEIIYAVWNDDKYLAMPKGGGSKIKTGKWSNKNWYKGTTDRVNMYKLKDDANAEFNMSDPNKDNLVVDNDPKYSNLYVLNLFADIENSGSKSLWVAFADIGKNFHILLAAECAEDNSSSSGGGGSGGY